MNVGVKTGRVTKNKKATVNKSAVMSEGTGSDSDGEGRDENEETKVDHTATPAMFKEEQEDDDYV